ncbi:DUF4345 family protein [Pseudomonas citronellolis]|jgi:hypothetical protein|uniref:DUF4345 family protein n=1 Tax=Pseudomonas citronellolis TaxID=53408 RepID=UPI00226D5A87|nr:DUF4345 family protein [Pseudomonas citronellolis]WAB94870.1 DUF4345 family protein [Pseudomonas citronellolis]WRT83893.1 DUF4345 family protein [Pseudomonas citronellolis]
MLFARFVLLLQALVWAGLGLLYWVRPYEMANLSGMLLMEPESVSDAQVFYGGHQFALALFLLFALRRRELLRAGLILVVLVQLTLTLSRLFIAWSSGLGIDTDATLYGLVYRGSVSLLAIFALYWLERGRREPEPAEPLPEAPVEKVRDADFEGL